MGSNHSKPVNVRNVPSKLMTAIMNGQEDKVLQTILDEASGEARLRIINEKLVTPFYVSKISNIIPSQLKHASHCALLLVVLRLH